MEICPRCGSRMCQCELFNCNCGQECLPARQFSREAVLHAARAEWIAKYHRDFHAALDRYVAVLFGGDK